MTYVREALAFDLYGTLVDPIRIWRQLENYVGDAALRVSELWRQKQLECTFRLTAMEQYEPFDQVTRKALDFALSAAGRSLEPDERRRILAEYDDLEPFDDVLPGLQQLRGAGFTMVVFSNGTPRMLEAAVRSAGLGALIEDLVSVDEMKCYKPSPRVYQHLTARLNRPADQVRLISSNPFDVIGADAAGLRVAWIDRTHGLFDPLGERPRLVVPDLLELAHALTGL